ncbi:hypothetical protein BKA67DRAFT_653736 [Truncatella angustata]|uniref:Zn(2)-C6 fungal-type domain-containing protein n=1 Tax=Truncatella angustata TaxID=152316 RepID=A0A9P8UWG9_9PEZI|nr:uncharacterized protein BKA67DRAFT_653736 [Truncatella angustata]KAH6660564.1 hypothetical protein BKA67DRAFT_653736 [Truncatella angustata]
MSSERRRACIPCTRAKRQCTKQTPSCRRCVLRGGLVCEYPPARRPAAALVSISPCAEAAGSSAAQAPQTLEQSEYVESLLEEEDIDFNSRLLELNQFGPSETDPAYQNIPDTPAENNSASTAAPWFLLPSSWKHEHSPPRPQEDVSTASIQSYVSTIRGWFYSWASGSSPNPLFHPELYRRDMPRCAQDAYTAISAYQHRTAANSATVLRIVGARAEQLVQEQALRETLGGELSMLEHLARVHALLAYQTIGLFDGDIRARARADEMVDTLFGWCEAMWWSAREAQRKRQDNSSPLQPPDDDAPPLPAAAGVVQGSTAAAAAATDGAGGGIRGDDTTSLWHTFVQLESVRRVFLTTNILQHVYLTLNRGWSVCPGGVTISIRRGVWEARSAYAWEKLVGGGDGGEDPLLGLQTMRLGEVLGVVRPVDVDDFGLAVMGLHFAENKLERWFDGKGGMVERESMDILVGLGIVGAN